jgi:PadR family transcriptional regulator, regulatory protein AphA
MAKTQKTKYAILGALSVFPMSGYDIKKWVSEVTGSFWAESSGQLYPTLSQLLKESLVRCDDNVSTNKRLRKLYSITKHGLKELATWINKPVEYPVYRDELRLKIFYGKNILKANCIGHLEQRRNQAKKLLAKHKKIEEHIKYEHKSEKNSFYWLLTIKGAIYHGEAEIKWCGEAIRILKRSKKIK